MKVTHFASPGEFRLWLEAHNRNVGELWVGFYNKQSGKGGLTYQEALDQALCFGWIDGIRKKVDEHSYTNRFTPRKPQSNWSRVNIARVRKLSADGLMAEPGLVAFGRRDRRGARYSYQRRRARLAPADERAFRLNRRAWRYFTSQPAGYRRLASFWVGSAKREGTRLRRLAALIEASGNGRRIGPASSATRSGIASKA